ncbi:chemotaxis protein CheW [Acetobacteraceae bacterium H6797]|nr:chemotaxis protein CheW [Acetobacteraceae bacterium H6797]
MQAAPDGLTSLFVRSAGEVLAIPLEEVAEVARPGPLTRVPHGPPGLLGLANLRGTVMPVVSLDALREKEEPAAGPRARLIVMRGETPVALRVEAVVPGGKGAAALDIAALLARRFVAQRRAGMEGGAAVPPPHAMAAPGRRRSFILFSLGRQDYALPMEEVLEVIRLPADVMALPEAEPAMLGAFDWRGAALPLLSLRALLGLPAVRAEKGGVILLRLGGHLAGLAIDAMPGIIHLAEEAIGPVPPVLTRGAAEARIMAIGRPAGRRLVSLLSAAHLLDAATMERLALTGETVAQESGTAATQAERFVLFGLGGETFGLPVSAVEEVMRLPGRLTPLPRAPAFLKGVTYRRGELLPVIDQGQRFEAQGQGESQRILVLRVEGLLAGFAVDRLSDIVSIPADSISATPGMAWDGTLFGRVARLPDGRMALLVEPGALLEGTGRDLLAAMAVRP